MKSIDAVFLVLAVIAVGLFLYLFRDFLGLFKRKGDLQNQPEDVTPKNMIGKEKIKLIPYKEALEASKQFIFKIAKIVMDKFSPNAKQTLIDLGKKLVHAGVQYLHVVDVFSISLQRQTSRRKALQGKKAKETTIRGT